MDAERQNDANETVAAAARTVAPEAYDGLAIKWLTAAWRCERQIVDLVSATPLDRSGSPALCASLEEQLVQSKAALKRLRNFLQRRDPDFGEDEGSESQALAGWADFSAGDRVANAALEVYAHQKMQLGLYRLLHMAAETAADPELQRLCEEALWEKDGTVARLKHEIASSGLMAAPADKAPGAVAGVTATSRATPRVEIHVASDDTAEVAVLLPSGEASDRTLRSVLTQAANRLAEAIADTGRKDGRSGLVQKAGDSIGRKKYSDPGSGRRWMS